MIEQSRFWAKVDKRSPDECWIWKGEVSRTGYGVISNYEPGKARRVGREFAHRFALKSTGVKLSKQEVVRHTCDVPLCVNPAHLLTGTRADNVRDAVERNRFPVGEARRNARLTDKQGLEIRALLASGVRNMDIAARFGVSRTTISDIKHGRTRVWQSV